jgi:hypothetical protein
MSAEAPVNYCSSDKTRSNYTVSSNATVIKYLLIMVSPTGRECANKEGIESRILNYFFIVGNIIVQPIVK